MHGYPQLSKNLFTTIHRFLCVRSLLIRLTPSIRPTMTDNPYPTPSPVPSLFLHPPSAIQPSQTPVIVHLRRDQVQPLVLNPSKSTPNETLNTRFGHFPHKTLLGVQPGSQVRSSLVGNERKRKRDGEEEETGGDAPSGFLHLLAPTSELWTISLPHRTQVVYTADSSYILHRLRVRPGTHIIEAGAGSGSFTHAAVRGVYSGYEGSDEEKGKVYSYEYHASRAQKLKEEIKEHGLEPLVQITHGDVCKDGFRLQGGRDKRNNGEGVIVEGVEKMDVDENNGSASSEEWEESPEATAVFLDLPAPWVALQHLTRNHQIPPTPLPIQSLITPTPPTATDASPLPDSPPPLNTTNQTYIEKSTKAWGPLHPTLPVNICTFSPCIEQIHRTVATLRKLSWTDVEMVEVQHRKLEVRRQKPGGVPGADGAYSSIEEAVSKLRGIVGWRKRPLDENVENVERKKDPVDRSQRRSRRDEEEDENPIIVTRLESELKTHTSYLLFATLLPPWTAADEEAAKEKVEAEKARYVMKRDKDGSSNWKKEKDNKRGKYGRTGTNGEPAPEGKQLSRKERKRLERAEKYGKRVHEELEGGNEAVENAPSQEMDIE